MLCRRLAVGLVLAALALNCAAPQLEPLAERGVLIPAPEVAEPLPNLGPLATVRSARAELASADAPLRLYVFWTSWCFACRAGVEQLNRLQAEAEEIAEIMLVTHEPIDRLAPVLDQLDVQTRVVGDDHGYAFERMAVSGVPFAVLVDADARIAAITHPSQVTADVLHRVAAGEEVDLPASDMQAAEAFSNSWDLRVLEASGTEPIVSIEPTEVEGKFARYDPQTGEIHAPGSSLETLAIESLGVDWQRVDTRFPASTSQRRFNVRIVPPDRSLDTSRRLLKSALQDLHGLRIREEQRQVDAAVLRRLRDHPGPPRSDAAEPSLATMGPTIQGVGRSEQLVRWVGSLVNLPTIDETGLDDELLELDIVARDRASLVAGLAEVGLELTREARSVTMVVLTVDDSP